MAAKLRIISAYPRKRVKNVYFLKEKSEYPLRFYQTNYNFAPVNDNLPQGNKKCWI
jgi:hypothetical protein